MAFADLPNNLNGATRRYLGAHIFDRVCGQNGIEQKLTKPYHPRRMASRTNEPDHRRGDREGLPLSKPRQPESSRTASRPPRTNSGSTTTRPARGWLASSRLARQLAFAMMAAIRHQANKPLPPKRNAQPPAYSALRSSATVMLGEKLRKEAAVNPMIARKSIINLLYDNPGAFPENITTMTIDDRKH